MLTRRTLLAAIAAGLAGPALAGDGLRLMMVRRRGCVHCAAWDREIGPVYARHPEGRAAPLMMVDVDGPYPDGLALENFDMFDNLMLHGAAATPGAVLVVAPPGAAVDADRLSRGMETFVACLARLAEAGA